MQFKEFISGMFDTQDRPFVIAAAAVGLMGVVGFGVLLAGVAASHQSRNFTAAASLPSDTSVAYYAGKEDINKDGYVGYLDVLAEIKYLEGVNYGLTGRDPRYVDIFDVNNDQAVSLADLKQIRSKYTYGNIIDLNGSGGIDVGDLRIITSSLNANAYTGLGRNATTAIGYNALADLDGSGLINSEDYVLAKGYFTGSNEKYLYDLNADGILNSRDMAAVESSMGSTIIYPVQPPVDNQHTPAPVVGIDGEKIFYNVAADLNLDGSITPTDMKLLRQRLATTYQFDVNVDGSLNHLDLVAVQSAMSHIYEWYYGSCGSRCSYISAYNSRYSGLADINADGVVNVEDMRMVRDAMGSTYRYDINGDRKLNFQDLTSVSKYLGQQNQIQYCTSWQPCPDGSTSGSVAEPFNAIADVNHDSSIDSRDVALVRQALGPSVRYDVNGDYRVDQSDKVYVSTFVGTSWYEDGSEKYDAVADVNDDGIIDQNDVMLIVSNMTSPYVQH